MGNSPENTTAAGSLKSIVVPTDDGDVTVRRLALLDYAGFLRAFKTLPKELASFIEGTSKEEFDGMSTMDTVMKCLPLLADSWGDLVAIIAVPTDKDAEFIGQLDGSDAVDVIVAALDLNNYRKIAATVKKLRARQSGEVAAAAPAEA
jgi:hypothetical protein